MFFQRKQAPGVSWIVAFLGNPGPRYTATRHNTGFRTADCAEKKLGVRIDRKKFHALTALCEYQGEKLLLMKPQTFMNLSGTAVQEAMSFYKTDLDHVLVVSDDIALPAGKLRVRRGGSAGGHNGLKDIIEKCGGADFPRVKIGVGPPPPDTDVAAWVLGTFPPGETGAMREVEETAVDAVLWLIENGVDSAMNKFN